MAVLSFFSLLGELGSDGSAGWAWVYGLLVCYWLSVAFRANKRGSSTEDLGDLSDDQKARIKAATDELHSVLVEIDKEMRAAHQEAKAEALAQVLKDKEKKRDGE